MTSSRDAFRQKSIVDMTNREISRLAVKGVLMGVGLAVLVIGIGLAGFIVVNGGPSHVFTQ